MALSQEELDAIIDRNNLLEGAKPKKMMDVPDVEEKRGAALFEGVEESTPAPEPRGAEVFTETKTQEEQPGFLKRFTSGVKEAFSERKEGIEESAQLREEGKQGLASQAFQFAGQTAGLFGDIIGEAVIEGVKSLPEPSESFQAEYQEAKTAFLNSEEGQAAIDALVGGGQIYSEFRETSPQLARNLESLVNVGEILVGGKAGEKAVKELAEQGVNVGKAGVTATREAVESSLQKQLKGEAVELVTPGTKTLTKAERLRRVEAGLGEQTSIIGKRTLKPKASDIRAAESVADVVDIKKNPFKNIEAIKNKIGTKAEDLDNALRKISWKFDKKNVKGDLVSVKNDSKILFGGDKELEKAYDTVIDEFMGILEKKPNDLNGLLDARRELDQVVKTKFPNLFDKLGGDNTRANAIFDVRNAVNNFIHRKAPESVLGKNVKKELSDMRDMFTAKKNISKNTLADLDTNGLQRAIKNLTGGLTGTMLLAGGLTAGSITGILSSPMAIAAMIGGGTWKVGKEIVTSKKLKQGIIDLLDKVGGKKPEQVKPLQEAILLLEEPKTIFAPPYKGGKSGVVK